MEKYETVQSVKGRSIRVLIPNLQFSKFSKVKIRNGEMIRNPLNSLGKFYQTYIAAVDYIS